MQEMNASEELEEMKGPIGTMMYSISTMYCLPVSKVDGGAAIGTCMGESLPRRMCNEAGFSSFRRLKEIENAFYRLYEARK